MIQLVLILQIEMKTKEDKEMFEKMLEEERAMRSQEFERAQEDLEESAAKIRGLNEELEKMRKRKIWPFYWPWW